MYTVWTYDEMATLGPSQHWVDKSVMIWCCDVYSTPLHRFRCRCSPSPCMRSSNRVKDTPVLLPLCCTAFCSPTRWVSSSLSRWCSGTFSTSYLHRIMQGKSYFSDKTCISCKFLKCVAMKVLQPSLGGFWKHQQSTVPWNQSIGYHNSHFSPSMHWFSIHYVVEMGPLVGGNYGAHFLSACWKFCAFFLGCLKHSKP